MVKGKVLAIDYGNSKVGFAVSDKDRLMAFGRGVARNLSQEDLLTKIKKMVEEESVDTLVFGLPLDINGNETEQTMRIRNFADQLKDFCSSKFVKLDFLDESFSTFEANQLLQKMGITGDQKKQTEDEMAAIVLVHRYIDYKP
jgi:putative Holliday junction resolvase